MGRKRKSEGRQKRIEGTYDEVPAVVEDARDDYVEAKREHQGWQTKTKERREKLIAVMLEAGLRQLEIDDGEKILTLIEEHKVRISIRKKSDDGDGVQIDVEVPAEPRAESLGPGADAATPAGPPVWREWTIGVLAQHGLPAGKVRLLEEAFDDRLGNLVDRMNRQGAEDHWWKDIKGFGESGYDKLTEAIVNLRKDRPEFQPGIPAANVAD